MILFSDGMHNFLDGVAIASAFHLGTEAGIITTILVLLHELPQEIGDFGVLLNSGFSKVKAL
jgi:zinc and cadmium transporter